MKKSLVIVLALTLFFAVAGTAAAESKLDKAVDDLLGIKYVYGGETKKGFDCSGFTMFLFNQFDIELPHWSKGQAQKGVAVKKADLRPGDLVFFNTSGSGISHVGIYLGNDKFAHAASNEGVVINKLSEAYYAKRYVTARRILGEEAFKDVTAEIETPAAVASK